MLALRAFTWYIRVDIFQLVNFFIVSKQVQDKCSNLTQLFYMIILKLRRVADGCALC